MIQVRLPDGTVHEVEKGVQAGEVLARAGGSAGTPIAARVNGRVVDLATPLEEACELAPIEPGSPEGLEVLRHSTSHVMAAAVKEIFPEARVGIGPAIEDGFYYDFDIARPFTPDDLARIEERMRAVARADHPFVRGVVPRDEALAMFRRMGEALKVEIIEEIAPEETITTYQCGPFVDLCRGPHVPSTGRLGAFKLLSVAGAYWRGDERNKMLQRIYGTAYPSAAEVEEHVRRLEEARRRDHRRLGVELDLFSLQELAGPGLPFWHPKGARIRSVIENFWREEHYRRGYELVYTPHIARADLWRTSGHLEFYRENMYSPMDVEGTEFIVKPMNCPFHVLIYKSRQRSYRDLPIRWAELGTVYRYERSGVLHGLLRVRGFTQDDAHLFCRPDQLDAEIEGLLDITLHFLRSFGFTDYDIFLSTRPQKFVGAVENWERATAALRAGLERARLPYAVDPGEGVFYGPKIDIKIRDVLGRSWQCTTLQVDYNLPERFDVTYVAPDGSFQRPIMIHRALLGSLERFLGVLIEHYAGAFPLWLAPVQVRVLPITDRQHAYAAEVHALLEGHGLRVEVDDRSEKIGYKIREAEVAKVPVMLVVGDREAQARGVAIRQRGRGDLGQKPIEEAADWLVAEAAASRPAR